VAEGAGTGTVTGCIAPAGPAPVHGP